MQRLYVLSVKPLVNPSLPDAHPQALAPPALAQPALPGWVYARRVPGAACLLRLLVFYWSVSGPFA